MSEQELDEFSETLNEIKNINSKIDNLELNDINNYIIDLEKIKKKYSTLKGKIKKILEHYSKDYSITSLENYIKELNEENEELNEENEELNEKFEKIEKEIIEILFICGETPKNDILDNLTFLKRKLHYNFSLFGAYCNKTRQSEHWCYQEFQESKCNDNNPFVILSDIELPPI